MPSEFTVFLVADAMLAKGERPSLRRVREAIPTGGSPARSASTCAPGG